MLFESPQPFGDCAWRARLPEVHDARAVLEALKALPFAVDAVVTERHALVTFASPVPSIGVERALEEALSGARPTAAPREQLVRVRYGPPDLQEVAAQTGLSTEDVVARHAGGAYIVVAIGFLPGFAYLRGLDPRLVVARRASPRTRVAASSVAIAGPYSGIYPFSSPGGWNVIGAAVGFAAFDPESGAALALGDRVRFSPEPP